VSGAHLLGLYIYAGSFENGPVGRNGVLLFSRQTFTGTGFSLVG
jgi:hypothetical protein